MHGFGHHLEQLHSDTRNLGFLSTGASRHSFIDRSVFLPSCWCRMIPAPAYVGYGRLMVLPVPSVTPPFRARARPLSVTLLLSVMLVSARMLPCHIAGPPPIVAELPTWKYTFFAVYTRWNGGRAEVEPAPRGVTSSSPEHRQANPPVAGVDRGVKSDDVAGRTRMYEKIFKGEYDLEAGLPESFNVLVRELKSLALNVELLKKEKGKE